MGHVLPPPPPSVVAALKQQRELRREVTLTMAAEILNERLWWPLYEEGGVDALLPLLPKLPPPPPAGIPPTDYIR